MVWRIIRGLTGICMLLAVSGCTEYTNRVVGSHDGAPADLRDLTGVPPPDKAAAPQQDSSKSGFCPASGQGYVLHRILLPTSPALALQYAVSFNGKKYNALGNILALIASQAPSMQIQRPVDEAVCAGQALQLLCLSANSGGSKATGMLWPATAACCSSTPCAGSGGQCSAQARGKCFAGSITASPSMADGSGALGGTVTGGRFSIGPGNSVPLLLSLTDKPGFKPLLIKLKYGVIAGTVAGGKITSGVLSGAVDSVTLDKVVIPAVAAIINAVYQDPATDKKTRDLFRTLFDANKDGKISADELRNNPLLKSFIGPGGSGDLDVDGDGLKEFSLGVGFQALATKIKQ